MGGNGEWLVVGPGLFGSLLSISRRNIWMKLNALKMKGVAIVLASSLAALPLSAGLIPGMPDLVWDPIQEGHMLTALAHDLQNIAILSRQLESMEYNLRAFPSRVKGTFKGYAPPFSRPVAGNLFGETALWADMAAHRLHAAHDVQNAWEESVPLKPSALWHNKLLSGDGRSRLADVEIADAAAINALQTNNLLRDQESVNESAILNLQASCLDADNNSEAMQANCASATGILNAQSVQTTNALLMSMTDIHLAQLKHRRDQEARRINHEAKMLDYQAKEQTNAVFSPDSMRRFQFQF
jgi:hypothetical protein